MVAKALFLDVDGVLNDHSRYPSGYCGLHADKLARLDRIVAATGCRIVLASAWRYLVLKGSMTLGGFANMLLSHGAARATAEALLDTLPEDGSVNDLHDRGKLAYQWLRDRGHIDDFGEATVPVVALDDGSWPDGLDLGYEVMDIPSVRPRPTVGLTDAEADRVIELLGRKE